MPGSPPVDRDRRNAHPGFKRSHNFTNSDISNDKTMIGHNDAHSPRGKNAIISDDYLHIQENTACHV
ncbi:hypothetical protein TNCV_871691 [Trichonephila clavipes]|nr:hypothetical protein TNCV_871691 [Trichonephila clavipes]